LEIGNDLHMDYSAIGLTTVLAARMEQLATPGSMLLTLEHAIAQTAAMGRVSNLGLWTGQLGAEYLLAGRLEDSSLPAQRALALTRSHGEQGYQAHALRLLGHSDPAPAPLRLAR
jgi:hypothetical protein